MKKARTLAIAHGTTQPDVEVTLESKLNFNISYGTDAEDGFIEVRTVRDLYAEYGGTAEEMTTGVTITEVMVGAGPEKKRYEQAMTIDPERVRDLHTLLGRVLTHAEAFTATTNGMVSRASGEGAPKSRAGAAS